MISKDIRELNIANVGFSFPRHTKKGFNVLVNYAGTSPIVVKTPPMKCVYGVDRFENKCFMKLSAADPSDTSVFDTLSEIDNRLIDLPGESNWFENPEDAFYHTPHMFGSRILRVQLPMRFQRIHNVTVVNESGEDLCIDNITPGTLIECELEWKNVWIIDKTFGYFWSVRKIEIKTEKD